ncbi:hypothetical protein [Synechococcus sp. PCC 6312]|uniref:hypothetical protein n=1 Tax=Synechococcus sp. (strain ATCC 27167 / PCC 6312) TaxID=195253 RepID=UPI00029ED14F|nr:hypothetical protein [Synechococcus sp. PCC 6312]AFY60325.1 hypothetical protein Syn6312_1136 [Synechococcus sp. PCC 6312]
MNTVVIQIGNSDDRLSQRDWVRFRARVREVVCRYCAQIHFDGHSNSDAVWQNACFVAEIPEGLSEVALKDVLSEISDEFGQDSIAFTTGTTEFV